MEKHLEEEVELKRYLLGELTQDEQVSIEERLFLDADYLLRLQALEDELIDDSVYDELSASEREKLELHFLSQPGRHDDLKIARALKRYGDSKAGHAVSSIEPDAERGLQTPKKRELLFLSSLFSRTPILGFSLSAAALVILSFTVWQFLNFMGGQNQTEPLQARSASPQPSESAARQPPPEDSSKVLADKDANSQVEQPVQQPGAAVNSGGNEGKQVAERSGRPRGTISTPARSLAVLLLPGGAVRGEGGSKTLTLPPDVGSVILKLPLVEGDNYSSYKATLQSGDRTLRVWTGLKSAAAETIIFVPVTVSAKLLRQQSYRIKLSGIAANQQAQEITTYPFKVAKR